MFFQSKLLFAFRQFCYPLKIFFSNVLIQPHHFRGMHDFSYPQNAKFFLEAADCTCDLENILLHHDSSEAAVVAYLLRKFSNKEWNYLNVSNILDLKHMLSRYSLLPVLMNSFKDTIIDLYLRNKNHFLQSRNYIDTNSRYLVVNS